jgi:hypothetical protein
VWQISFDGSGWSEFVQGMYDPQGMDTDTTNQKLYFTEHQGNDVKRCNYDGSAIELVWQGRTNQDFPADVAVDPEMNLMFITVQSVPTLLNGTLVRGFVVARGATRVQCCLILLFCWCAAASCEYGRLQLEDFVLRLDPELRFVH